MYANLDSEKGALKTKLENGKESAYQSYFLAKICTQAPIPASAARHIAFANGMTRGCCKSFERLGFRQLVLRLSAEGQACCKSGAGCPRRG